MVPTVPRASGPVDAAQGVDEVAVRGRLSRRVGGAVGQTRWSGPMSAGVGVPEQRQRELELLAQDRAGALDAGLRRRRPAPSSIGRPTSTPRAPSASAIAMSRPRRIAAVDPDLGPAADRGDDLGEGVGRRLDADRAGGRRGC